MPWEAPVTTAGASGLGTGSDIRESYSAERVWHGSAVASVSPPPQFP